jgi:hypothetical protein
MPQKRNSIGTKLAQLLHCQWLGVTGEGLFGVVPASGARSRGEGMAFAAGAFAASAAARSSAP